MPPKGKKTGVHGVGGSSNKKKATPKTGVHGFTGSGSYNKVKVNADEPQQVKASTTKKSKPHTLGEMDAEEYDEKTAQLQKSFAKQADDYEPHHWADGLSTDEDAFSDAEIALSDDESTHNDVDATTMEGTDKKGLQDRFDEHGNLVESIVEDEVPEEEVYRALSEGSSRAKHFRAHEQRLDRMFHDHEHLADTQEDDLGDIVSWEKSERGAIYDLVPDKNGSIVRIGPGVYQDRKTKEILQRCRPGHKSLAKGEGKSARNVRGRQALAKIYDTLARAKEQVEAKAQE